MSTPLVTYDDAKSTIGILPTLVPRPNSTNLRTLTTILTDKLTTIRSQQSAAFGYAGIVDEAAVYAMKTATAWQDWPDPGPHQPGGATRDERDNAKVLYDADKLVYDSQLNVVRAINDALNAAVPGDYRRSTTGNGIGVHVYRPSDCPRAILANLRTRYGKATPSEKAQNENQFGAGWNPADPIEVLFSRLEECFLFAAAAQPAYTMEQMIDKAIIAIQNTGLYSTAILEWNGFLAANKTWIGLKLHFEEAYELRLASSAGTSRTNGYVNNAEAMDDDDSINSITASLSTIHLANNANYQALQDNVQAARQENAAFSQQIAALRSEMSQYRSASVAGPPIAPTYVAAPAIAPVPAYIQPQAPAYQPTYQQTQGGYGRGGSRTRNNRGRGGRGGRGNRRNGSYGTQNTAPAYVATYGAVPPPAPTTYGAIPPPAAQTQAPKPAAAAYSNTTKTFNNWEMCYSCGWDVEEGHNSMTCQNRKTGHQVGCTRANAPQYIAASHWCSKKAMHKVNLPVQQA